MATLVQSNSGGTPSGVALAVAFPGLVSAGNTLVAIFNRTSIGDASAQSITDNRGNVWTKAVTISKVALRDSCEIWYTTNVAGGATTVTAAMGSGQNVTHSWLAVHEYYGQVSVPTLFMSATGTSTTPSPGAIAISSGAGFVVAAYANLGTNLVSGTVAVPFTSEQQLLTGNTNGVGGGSADDLSGSGNVTATWTLSGSVSWTAAAVSFNTTSSGGGSGSSGTGAGASSTINAPQSSQVGRNVVLTAVALGNVYYSLAGTNQWTPASNSTGSTLVTSGVVRSAANNQKLYFADGSNYLYFDPKTTPPSVQSWTASAGSLPSNSGNTPRLICTWRGRTVLSGIKTDPQNWFMSRVSDPTDFNYFPLAQDATQPIAGNNSTLGLVGDVVTGLVPIGDDVLVCGCDHTLWQFTGDPMAGGSIDNISWTIGMAWGNAWCIGPDGTLFFFSNKMGIYSIVPGQKPQRMSQQIDGDLASVDTGLNIIRLQWDDVWQGFHVWISLASAAAATMHFFYENRTGAWWKDVFGDNNLNPLCCVTYDGNLSGDRASLIGSWDGFVRTPTPANGSDDGIPIASSVVVGPLLTKDMDDVLLKDLQAILGLASGPVSYAVYVGATAEIALASVPVATGTWSIPGRNFNTHVRRSGHAVWIKLTATSQWSMEAIRARVAGKDKVRRRIGGGFYQ